MSIEMTVFIIVALMFISYQVGNLIGKAQAYHAGFLEGASNGIDKILQVLKKDYGIIMGYDDIVIESNNKAE
jgi:hypothetical protein